jgi:arylsulfatase A-like enzyme
VAGLLLIGALLLGLLEIVQIALAAPESGLSAGIVFRLGFVGAALLLNAALLSGAVICIGAWALAPVWHRRRVRLVTALAGLVLLAGACWWLAVRMFAGAGVTRALGSAKTPATVALCGALFAAAVLIVLATRQLFRRRRGCGRGAVLGWGAGILFAAILADLVNRRLYVGLYPEIHGVLALVTSVLVFTLLVWLGLLRRARPALLAAVGLVALIGGIAAGAYANGALAARRQLVGSILTETTIAREVLSLAWSIADTDRDGHSPVLGGGDCDDADPRVHPGALEVAGNGVDEDCIGGDLRIETEAPPVEEVAPYPTAAAPPRIADVPATPDAAAEPATPRETSIPPAEAHDASAVPQPSAIEPPRTKLPDILLFSVDALRADRLSCYGYSGSATPTMDEVAARGTRFTNAYVASTSSATSLPTVVAGSYFSSLYPEVKTGGSAVPKDNLPMRTVLNDLASHGYRVIATVPASYRNYFSDEGIEWSAPSGLMTPSLTAIFRQVEEGPDGPLALWFHHMDAHLSFTREFIHEFRQSVPVEVLERYDAAVRKVDDDLRTLLEWQAERSDLDSTIVVITADHGEEFAEHHGFGHARTLYEEVLRVPLVISVPDSAPRVVDQRVSIVDLAPTLREIVGIEPAERSDGVSLVPLLAGQSRAHPPIYAENFLSSRGKAVLWRDWKLINTRGNVFELYDLRTDPHERTNLVDEQPSQFLALQKLLALCAASGCRDIEPDLLEEVGRTLTAP